MDRRAKYDLTHVKHISLKLNLNTDSDLMVWLFGKPYQTEIKRLMRIAIEKEQQKKPKKQ